MTTALLIAAPWLGVLAWLAGIWLALMATLMIFVAWTISTGIREIRQKRREFDEQKSRVRETIAADARRSRL